MPQKSPSRTPDQVIDQAQQTAGQVVEGTQEKVGQVVDQAKQQTGSLLTARKDQAADTLYTVAHALRQTGQQLREQDQTSIAGYADQAATRVESVSGYLHGRDVRQLVDDTEGFARQRPAVFVGGALTLGILAARFLKSSKRKATTPTGETIPPERALVEATPTPADRDTSGTVMPTATSTATSSGTSSLSGTSGTPDTSATSGAAPVRVSGDETIPAVVADAPALTGSASY